MRLVAWNCNMALHRKYDALQRLRPDIAVISECAAPERLAARGALEASRNEPVWIGLNPNKGLAVFAFNGFRAHLADPFFPTLRYVAPVRITGPARFNLLAVWAQNASAGSTRKRQAGPLRRALTKYKAFLSDGTAFVAGDLNNNVVWDRPGWTGNHATAVAILERFGLTSAYHALSDEAQGEETTPTLYWRDRTEQGPTYHIDYIFVPRRALSQVTAFDVGSYQAWCGAGLSDHAPVVIDIAL